MNVQFVAEVANNHNRDLERCLRFIDKAAEIGCGGIKFPLFRLEHVFAHEIRDWHSANRAGQGWELPLDFFPTLQARCEQRGIQLGCTPFHVAAVRELCQFVHFYKISSYELLCDDLLEACAHSGKNIVLSTGMATLAEVKHAVKVLNRAGCEKPVLLHCISEYPARAVACNLSAIQTLRRALDCEVGWSDHSADSGVIYRAVHRWQAQMVEFHLDLDGRGAEFGVGHCWLPDRIKQVIAEVRSGLVADGNGIKAPRARELREVEWRADPADGRRPFLSVRKTLLGETSESRQSETSTTRR